MRLKTRKPLGKSNLEPKNGVAYKIKNVYCFMDSFSSSYHSLIVSFLFWIIMIFSFLGIQDFLLLFWQSLFFNSTFNGILDIDFVVKSYKMHLKVQSKRVSTIIDWLIYSFPVSTMYQILEELLYRILATCHSHLYYNDDIDVYNHFPKLELKCNYQQ